MRKAIGAFIIVILLVGCDNNQLANNGNTEGLIRYSIEYPSEIESQIMASLLPKEMDLLYKQDCIKIKVKGEYNVFALEFLSNANDDSCFTMFKVFSKKLYYKLKPNEKWFFFDNTPEPSFKIIKDSIRQIAGLHSHLVQLNYDDSTQSSINAYYTKQLNIDNKLFRTSLGNIPGVPLQFEMVYNGLTFKFKALSLLPYPKDEMMSLPLDYEVSSRVEISSLINSVIN